MKDVAGRELVTGQIVATTLNGYTDELQLCRVDSFTPQKVRLRRLDQKTRLVLVNWPETLAKFPMQVCIVDFPSN
jgi:hypothetical protein